MVSNSPPSTLSLLRRIWVHLSRRRRLQLAALLLVMLASGLAELVSLGAVLPFLAVLTNPQQLWQQQQEASGCRAHASERSLLDERDPSRGALGRASECTQGAY